jgi:hypothetical protein
VDDQTNRGSIVGPSSPVAETQTHFAVTRERGPNWNGSLPMREQERWDEHARFMDLLVDDGCVLFGGPLGDGARILLIMRAESEDEIEGRLAEDPWTQMGLLRIVGAERWQILLRAAG